MVLSPAAPLGDPEGIESMRVAFVAILVSVAAAFGAAVAGNYCTAWQGSAPSACVAYGYQSLAFAVLGAAALLFVGGILALAWGPHVPESPEGLYCANCGHSLIWRPQERQWYCERCGRTYRSDIDPAFFPREVGRYL